jgi:DNA-binding response OmpR family regulator
MMNEPEKISLAIVEDNEGYRDELEALFKLEGFNVRTADSGASLDHLLATAPADLVVLDINLPEEDGLSIAARLRESYPETRIIMLTGRVRGVDKVQGYEAGADAYLTKPHRPREVLALIRSMTRRIGSQGPSNATSLPCWRLSPHDLSIMSPGGELIALSRRDVGVLKRFHTSPNRCLDYVALLDHLELPATQEGKNQAARIISRLRLKIQPHTCGAASIKAHRHDGYQLCLDIQII